MTHRFVFGRKATSSRLANFMHNNGPHDFGRGSTAPRDVRGRFEDSACVDPGFDNPPSAAELRSMLGAGGIHRGAE